MDQGKELRFAVAGRQSFAHDLAEFGLDGAQGELPLVALRTATGDKYVMTEEFT